MHCVCTGLKTTDADAKAQGSYTGIADINSVSGIALTSGEQRPGLRKTAAGLLALASRKEKNCTYANRNKNRNSKIT